MGNNHKNINTGTNDSFWRIKGPVIRNSFVCWKSVQAVHKWFRVLQSSSISIEYCSTERAASFTALQGKGMLNICCLVFRVQAKSYTPSAYFCKGWIWTRIYSDFYFHILLAIFFFFFYQLLKIVTTVLNKNSFFHLPG